MITLFDPHENQVLSAVESLCGIRPSRKFFLLLADRWEETGRGSMTFGPVSIAWDEPNEQGLSPFTFACNAQ